MTMRYLLDTDWVIHYLNAHQGIVERLYGLIDEGLGLSIMSLAELYEGVYYSRDPEGDEQDLNDFLRGIRVLGIDEAICKTFGKERGRLRAAGMIIGDFDCLSARRRSTMTSRP
jgi:predicted nucleic acid-binding protein